MKDLNKIKLKKKILRKKRAKSRISDSLENRKRFSVYKSLSNNYAQIIDDAKGITLAAADDRKLTGKNKTEKAAMVGKMIAEAALEKGVKKVVFDKGSFKYHGRVKALAEAAREAGLDF